MDFNQLLLWQFIAHVLADFIFQSDNWVRHKRRYGFKSGILYWHAFVVFGLSYIFSFQWGFIYFAIVIMLFHLIIDGLKMKMSQIKIGRFKPFAKWIFFWDQFLHIVVIVITVQLFSKYFVNNMANLPFSTFHLMVILAYLLCLKPANIVIREIFAINNITLKKETSDDLLNAGKLIGNIERTITLTLLLFGQFQAIGFIIAGKSILRYEGVKSSKTEYVLIGTLLSFGIAIIMGLIVLKLNKMAI